ncbi:fluoride efflux transporter FluC [Weissella sagaensis]|uniref:Fluoride-specific ion channel FluC n=1 Tax=Weissella sagaensis TaxID=2559928 RepID=A0ABW1RT21_9LACO|nr:CrcB family protein [Weissella sagaensis]KAA8433067.1 CrcB family protein [Weissella paramesenteroides]QDJ59192.1 CrcB family protein [Weissella hellenica]KAA8438011.1 CrcB family protein [Weissella paramesenteroides]QEA56485.1 CrcB family protein [Weissella hellenica]UEG67308.1 CrcB family protein [Weissella hellenica]
MSKKKILLEILAVSSGGFIGGVLRGSMMLLFHNNLFPWETIIVNLSGTFISALLVVLFSKMINLTQITSDFIMVGILGAYTTYSTALVDMVNLSLLMALVYLVISVVGGVLVVIFSRYLGNKMVLRWQK